MQDCHKAAIWWGRRVEIGQGWWEYFSSINVLGTLDYGQNKGFFALLDKKGLPNNNKMRMKVCSGDMHLTKKAMASIVND